MNNWFTVKVKYTKQLDNGALKRVSEPYLLAAMTFTDAEARIYESKILLTEVVKLIEAKEFHVVNVDSTVVMERPKLNPHIPAMQAIISDILKIDSDSVSIKATTHEKVDSFGQEKAIKAYAACLLNK